MVARVPLKLTNWLGSIDSINGVTHTRALRSGLLLFFMVPATIRPEAKVNIPTAVIAQARPKTSPSTPAISAPIA
jgi:hypothetical protein